MNFYNFNKMSVDAELPSKKRMKKTDPSKFKHRLFHKNAVSEWIRQHRDRYSFLNGIVYKKI